MKHYTSEEWIDFVNQVTTSSRKVEMEEHLKAGCRRCEGAVSRWRRVQRAAAAEVSYQPPSDVVRMAKAAFSSLGLIRERRASQGIKVLFDSFREPAFAGVRSIGGAGRRLLYRADPFRIDLQIEAKLGGNSIVVTGQLLDLRYPENVGREVPVVVSNQRGRAIQARTNEFGEFHHEIENSGALELVFRAHDAKPVTISLQDVLGQHPTDDKAK
jgi:hypothetical protein